MKYVVRSAAAAILVCICWLSAAFATTYTTTVPGTTIMLPTDYPQAGGVAFAFIGNNGNLYYQFSNPTGAFRGFNNRGTPTQFRGNPFTINNPVVMDCGFSTCRDYFGGGISKVYIRFSAYDGDTQPRGFDENDISLIINGFNVGSWSGIQTEATNTTGTQSYGFATGFGNNTFNTTWFSSTNPALLANILDTNQTTTQVLDDDPNDNYWDFRRGNTLTNASIVTVAPGYTLEKSADKTKFTSLGETINYSYKITNIGSVPIRDLSVFDDVIGNVSCTDTVILDVSPGQAPDSSTCTASYRITQEDFDRGFVKNTANAVGKPDYGNLGQLTDDFTVIAPTESAKLFVNKTSTVTRFGNAGTVIPYSIFMRNDGNVTLSNFTVTDPKLPSLSCNVPDLAPGKDFTCTGNYTVLQSDVDAYILSSTSLVNTVTVDAATKQGTKVQVKDTLSLRGPGIAPGVDVTKTALTANYDTVGASLIYQIRIENTGNVSYPVPTVTDVLTSGASCPVGDIAPGKFVICTASYAVDQDDIDTGKVENTASVLFRVRGVRVSDSDTATVSAIRTTGLSLDKRLMSTSPTTFDQTRIILTYEYVLTNTGNVKLRLPRVTDNLVRVTCSDSEILPFKSIICKSSNYLTTQINLDNGEVINIATATAREAGPTANTITSNSDSVTVPADQKPELTLTKIAPTVLAANFVEGKVVTYSFRVKNTGNVSISSTTVGATEISITDDKIGTFTCGQTPLSRNSTMSCTANYTITAQDEAAGTVVNLATAAANKVVSNKVSAQISPVFQPEISLAKSTSTTSISATSDTINYSFLVKNIGNTTMTLPDNAVKINDPLLTSPADCSAQPASLGPSQSFSCTGVRVGVTQPEMDAGQVDNAATAEFDFTNGGQTIPITSDQSTASIPVNAAPSMVFTKSGPAQFETVGQSINYTFKVKNDGNVTLLEVAVTDPLIPGLSCTLTNIAPGKTDSCTGTYKVTQPDVDAEVINNTATAAAIPAQGAQFSKSDSVATPINPANSSKVAKLDKVASPSTFTAAGQQITYTMKVTNTGTQTLSNLKVTDVLDAGFSCTIARLAPTVTDSSCTFVHTIDQDDLNAGKVVNVASLDSTEITTDTDTETVTGPARAASYEFTKSVSGNFDAVNDQLDYTFRVKNTGNVTLTTIKITDPFFGNPISCTIPSLAPGAIDSTTCLATYVVKQPDLDAGRLNNTATATVDAPTGVGDPPDQTSTAVSNGPTENASVTVDKKSTDGVFVSATDTEVYTFSVTNNGNVTLTNLKLDDASLGFKCDLADLAPGASTTVCDDTSPLSATKAFDQGDVDATNYINKVTVTGQSKAKATPVTASDSETVTGPAQAPTISLTKKSTFVGTMDTVGQVLTYDYTVLNTGNISITSEISIADDKIADVDCPAIPQAGIAPASSLTCTAEYVVTLADLDAGKVVNNATATVTQAVIPQKPGDDPFVVVMSNKATEIVTAKQVPGLRLNKRVKSTSSSSYGSPGDTVIFEYVVTNIGNVTTTGAITIVDDKIPGTLSCGAAGIAPKGTFTCEQTWTADLPALDAGSVTNTAKASMAYDGTTVDSNDDRVTINAVQKPELSISKTFLPPAVPDVFDLKTKLKYSIVVTNSGNVSIDAPITLTDNLTTPSCPTVPGGKLAPGQTLNCTSSHEVTQDDLDLGASTNVVYATGAFNGKPVQSPSDSAIYPIGSKPALSLTKTALTTNVPFDATGDVITYKYVVQNSGNVGLTSAVMIEDDVLGTVNCKPAGIVLTTTAGDPNNDSYTCQATYEITQDDLDRGFVTNNATANTLYPPSSMSPTKVTSPNASATVKATEKPELTVAKLQTGAVTKAKVGDVLTYQITAENTGNQTISGVSISDPLLPTLKCTVAGTTAPANVVLLPGESLVCSANYIVPQSDIDAQSLINTATSKGTDPQGETIKSTGSHTQTLVEPTVDLAVTKVLFPDPGAGLAFSDPGQELVFVVSVKNTGNITLKTVTVTDDRLVVPTSCTIGPIAPGKTDDSCEFTYTVTQADMDQDNGASGAEFGGFTNTASVTAIPDNVDLKPIKETGSVFVRGPPQEPKINLVKESKTTEITTYNQRIEYIFTIANTGNVTLFEAPKIVDDKIGTFTCSGIPAKGLAPSEHYQCTAEYFVTQPDLDAGFVKNSATATSSELNGPFSTELTIDGAQKPGIKVVKTADPASGAVVNGVINYSYAVTNTGNVTLSNVTLSDKHTSSAGTVTLAITGEGLTNDANELNTSTDSAGLGIWSSLGPGDTVTFKSLYTVTQGDFDAQKPITNVASVTAGSPSGANAKHSDTASVTLKAKAPGINVTKSADKTKLTDPAVVGQLVSYTIKVANTGDVTLDNVVLNDVLKNADDAGLSITLTKSGDTGIVGKLEVDESWTYSGTYAITQKDIDSGQLINTASVTADDPQDVSQKGTLDAPVTVELAQGAEISVSKTADETGLTKPAVVGQKVSYTIKVANKGNVTLDNVVLTDVLKNADADVLSITLSKSGDAGVVGKLEVGETWTYSGTYAITQNDINSGQLINTADVTADDPADNSHKDALDNPVMVNLAQDPLVRLVKSSTLNDGGDGRADKGDTITYRYELTNAGNVRLFDLSVAETAFKGDGTAPTPKYVSGGADLDKEGDAIDLAVNGGTVVFTATYTVTQTDIDAGEVSNSATAKATSPNGTVASDVSGGAIDDDKPTITTIKHEPGLETIKTAFDKFSTPPKVGDPIFYSIMVKNSGNVTLTPSAMDDAILTALDTVQSLVAPPAYDSGDVNKDGKLNVGETWTYSAEYRLTQSAIDAGGVKNIATANAGDPTGSTVSDKSDDGTGTVRTDKPTVTNIAQSPAIAVVKTAVLDLGADGIATVDDVVTYSYTVTNHGNVSLLDVSVAETSFDGSGAKPVAAIKTGGSALGGGAALDLAVGASMVFEATYQLTQVDIDKGKIINQATAKADTVVGTSVKDLSGSTTDNDTPNLLKIPEAPGVEVTKTADVSGFSNPVVVGNSISFTVTVRNTGNATLKNVDVTDTFTRRDGKPLTLALGAPSGDAGVAGKIEVGETWTYTVSYALDQDDIDAGGVQNQVKVAAETDQGTSVGDLSDDGDDSDGDKTGDATVVGVQGLPSATLTKRENIGSPNPYDAINQVILYAFDIKNTGNITITAPVQISDPLIAGQGTGPVSCPAPPIKPGASVTCTGSYRVGQPNLDSGKIDNVASLLINQPVVPVNPGDPTSVSVKDTSATISVPADQKPSVKMTKVLSSTSPVSFSAVDDTISYDFKITNTGNVTFAGPITVNDDVIGNGLACGTGPLAPGGFVSCTHTYDADQNDLNTGEITNKAIGLASFNSAPVNSPVVSVTVPAIQTKELEMTKEIVSATPDLFDENTVLVYKFTVKNTGNVTIDAPIKIHDPVLDSTNCPVPAGNVLLPNATLECSGKHKLTVENLKLGALVNVASATGKFDGVDVTSLSDDAVYPVGAKPTLALTKDSVPTAATFAADKDKITYTYTVTNNSSVGFTEDITIKDNRIATPILCHDASAEGVFGVGQTATCQAIYEVDQDDLDAGKVVNEAIATTVFAPGTTNEFLVLAAPVTKTVPAIENPKLKLGKVISDAPNPAKEGDVVEFTLTATNTGNQTIAGIAITDPLLGTLSCKVDGLAAPTNVVLAPQKALVCTGTYKVKQSDIDAQSLTNAASVSGSDPHGDPVKDDTSVTVPLADPKPALSVAKTIEPASATGQPAFVNVTDAVKFRITIKNDGNVTLKNIVVTDSLNVTPANCNIATLAPQQTDASCLFTYVVNQDDINGAGTNPFGGFDNTARATSVAATPDAAVVKGDDTIFVRGPDHAPELTLKKTANLASITTAGQNLSYSYLVTNSGNITLTAPISVSDDRIANVNCPAMPLAGLAPNASITCTGTDTVSQADVDAGFVTNVAAASSTEAKVPTPPGTETAKLTIPVVTNPSLSLKKTGSETGRVSKGTTITYTYEVTNDGNQTITDVSVADTHTSAAGSNPLTVAGETLTDNLPTGDSSDAAANGVWDDLKPGDVLRFSATYLVTQADVDQQVALSNNAKVSGTAPSLASVDDTDAVTILVDPAAPSLETVKVIGTSTLSDPAKPGEIVNFAITVKNDGNQTLKNVTLIDTLTRLDGTSVSIAAPVLTGGDGGVAGEMLPNEIWTFTASHELTQDDIDAGGISNQVQARGLSPSSALIIETSDDGDATNGDTNPAILKILAQPSIVGEKTVLTPATELGKTITFQFKVTNIGNVTLRNVAVAKDMLTRLDASAINLTTGPIFAGATLGSGAGVLKPSEVATYTATYTLTQPDIDAGGVQNSATVTGTPPVGGPVTDVTDDGDDSDGNTDNDPTQMVIPAQPSIGLTKRLGDTAPAAYQAVGTEIPYDFVVLNTGNVTLSGTASIADPLITNAGQSITCPALPVGGLIPGKSVTCTGSYFATQPDIDAGQIDNTAVASLGTLTSDPAKATIPALPLPGLEMIKTAPNLEAAEFLTNTQVTYTFTTKNIGNTTIFDPITVTDTLIPASDITCPTFPITGIPPKGEYVCTGTYTVTSTDVDLGGVTNLASGSDGTTTSLIDSVTIPNSGVPSLLIEKKAIETSFDAVGDTLNYTFTVTNSGTRAFARDVVVTDTLIGDVTCFSPTVTDPDFGATEVATCSGIYTIDQDDLDRGYVVNEAYASTIFGANDTKVLSAPDAVTVKGDLTPTLTIAKSAATLPVTGVDQLLTYTVTVTNTGNQTITSVVATDPMLSGFTCEDAKMAPKEVLTCTGTYKVVQGDVDAGSLSNTANVNGVSPQGARIKDTTTYVVDMPDAKPGVLLTKKATPTPFGPVDSKLTYLFTVENTGNVTLRDLTVTDAMVPNYSCKIPTVAPKTSNQTCSLEVLVMQKMVDDGSIDNTASIEGNDPNGTKVNGSTTITTAGPTRAPSLEATKVALPAPGVVGAVVPFVLSVENTGNVTLSNVSVVDTMLNGSGDVIALDAPFALDASTDAGGDGKLGVGETWTYLAQVTLTQGMVNSGGLTNQVMVDAVGPSGAMVKDVSDNGDDTDGETKADKTVFKIVSAPELYVVKSVKKPGTAVGDEVVFLIKATNVGNVALTGVSASDTMSRRTGVLMSVTPVVMNVPDPLNSGAVATWEVRHILTQKDIDAGGLSNTALISGTAPDKSTISDVSANDDPTDGNIKDDPTILNIAPAPSLEVIKKATEIGMSAGKSVVYQITIKNTGTMTLTGIGSVDALTDLAGQHPRSPSITFVSADGTPTASVEGTLVPGETATYRSEVTLTQDDVEAGGLVNSVTASAQTLLGGTLQDVSDDDGTGTSDPTITKINAAPSLDVIKTVSKVEILFPTVEQVTFKITVKNTGNVIQTGLKVVDDLASFASPATLMTGTYPIELTATGFTDGVANAGYDGDTNKEMLSGNPTLAPGETGTITVKVAYSTATGAPGPENIASATSKQLVTPSTGKAIVTLLDADGDGVPDFLEQGGGDRDGDGIPNDQDYDPTGYFYCEDTGRILSGGLISVSGNGFTQSGVGVSGSINIVQDGSSGFFQFFMTAPGSYTLGLTYPASGVASTARPSLGSLDATSLLPSNPASIGSSEFGATGFLADASAGANTFYTTFVVEPGDPFILNNNIPMTQCVDAPAVLATKTADRTNAVFGETINYSLSFRNDGSLNYNGAQIIDRLPAGMVYTPNSARVNGAAVEPVITGGTHAWTVNLAPAQTITVTFAARVRRTGEFGVRTNRTWLQNAANTRVSNVARADVRIDPEHVFDCSDVIGKVFDDRNSNGYQDGSDVNSAPEPGLAGVRLVTPDGLLITTDEFGRFSVPCAALPRNIGSNFQLKLDTRTLPSGYRVTTENPRNTRLTAGKIAKMNFGASLSQVIRIDVDANAFFAGSNDPSAELNDAILDLLQQIASTPSVVRLTYVLDSTQQPPIARERLNALENLIRTEWRKSGKYNLIVERTVSGGVK